MKKMKFHAVAIVLLYLAIVAIAAFSGKNYLSLLVIAPAVFAYTIFLKD